MVNNKLLLEFMSIAVCSQCVIAKLKTEFYWNKNGKISSYVCKECSRTYQKTRSQTEAGKAAQKVWNQSEAGKAAKKAYAQSKAGKAKREAYRQSEAGKAVAKAYSESEAGKAAQKEWKQSEAGRATQKRWRESEEGKVSQKRYEQSEAGKAYKKAWRQSEVGKAASIRKAKKRRSLIAAEPNTLTKEEWMQIIENQSNCCNGCGVSFDKVKPTEDHIIPIGKGPGREKGNIQALCGTCNSIKGPRSMKYLLERLEKRDKA